ncbi:MAG TPA: DNA-3-methyladenine glycosylase [Clostridia bacterium]|nr:DNA-3-methyladenine glycosylase [Clostridia bacterium]
MTRLGMSFFERDTALVAKDLLGKWLLFKGPQGITGGIIVETEAYLGFNDPACHSVRGCTPRNKVMFGPAGKIYIYLIYGIHYCLNVTTACIEKPEAVLFRAIEPKIGMEIMKKHRKKTKLKELCSGPGKLVQALGINPNLNGSSAIDGPIGFYYDELNPDFEIVTTTRIGISQAKDWPLRFYIKGSKFISRP